MTNDETLRAEHGVHHTQLLRRAMAHPHGCGAIAHMALVVTPARACMASLLGLTPSALKSSVIRL